MRSDHLAPTIRRLAKRGDVYCRLLVAHEQGVGLRLSADDVRRLVTLDDAIQTAAESLADDTLDREAVHR